MDNQCNYDEPGSPCPRMSLSGQASQKKGDGLQTGISRDSYIPLSPTGLRTKIQLSEARLYATEGGKRRSKKQSSKKTPASPKPKPNIASKAKTKSKSKSKK